MHKKRFVNYVKDLCTKKEDTMMRGAKPKISKQKFTLSRKEKEKVRNGTYREYRYWINDRM